MAVIKIDGMKFNLLSSGYNNEAVAINDSEAAKVFELGASDKEANLLQVANKINTLLVKFLRVEPTRNYTKELLVMERLYPLQYRAIDVETRKQMFETFLKQLRELHSQGFAHWDVKRPSHSCTPDRLWDNIILTKEGLRLIDTGNSVVASDYEFEDAVKEDIQNAMEFREVFLIP